MDLVYIPYRARQGSKVSPDWLTEGNTVSVVSSQNILLFATTTQLTDRYCQHIIGLHSRIEVFISYSRAWTVYI